MTTTSSPSRSRAAKAAADPLLTDLCARRFKTDLKVTYHPSASEIATWLAETAGRLEVTIDEARQAMEAAGLFPVFAEIRDCLYFMRDLHAVPQEKPKKTLDTPIADATRATGPAGVPSAPLETAMVKIGTAFVKIPREPLE